MKNQFTLRIASVSTLVLCISMAFGLSLSVKGQNGISIATTSKHIASGAELITTLPAIVPATGAEFNITLSLGDNQLLSTCLIISINEQEAKLQHWFQNFEGTFQWENTYPYNNTLYFWVYESDFVDGVYSNKFKLTPLVSGERTFKISVTQNDEEIANYETAYNVVDPIPAIEIVAPDEFYGSQAIDFGDVTVGESVTKTFTITPYNLVSDINLSFTNETLNGLSMTPTTITQNVTEATTITVTYAPMGGPAVFDMSTSIKIAGGGLPNESELSIFGKSINPNAPVCSFDPTELDFGENTFVGTTKTMILKIKTKNTTKPITLELSQWDVPPIFSLSPMSIEPSIAEVETELTVTFTPHENELGSLYAFATIYANSEEEMEQVSCGIYGYGVIPEPEPIVTITPESWDGGEVDIKNNNQDGTHAVDFEITLSDVTEAVALIIEPVGVFFLDPTSPTFIPVETLTTSVSIKYKNITLGSNTAKLIFKGAESGEIYTEANMSITGIDILPPSIEVSITSLTFTSTLGVESDPQNITVVASNLTEDLDVNITSDNANMFSYTLSGWIEDQGGRIRVVYTPTTEGNHLAILTIKSGDTIKQVQLGGTSVTNSSIGTNKTELSFYSNNYLSSDPQPVTVTASNLTSEMAVSIVGKDKDDFTFITNNWNPMTGGEIVVSFEPKNPNKFIFRSEAILVINSNEVTNEIKLEGNNHVSSIDELNTSANIFASNKAIIIKLNNPNNTSIKVLDVLGKVIIDTVTDNNIVTIDLASKIGIYIVMVSTDNQTITKKVIIK